MKTAEHFNTLSSVYDIKKPEYYYRLIKKFYSEIIPPGKNIIDIGCGTGEMLAYLKPKIGIGIDISEKMIEIAKKKYPRFNFRLCSAENITHINANNIDYIIMIDVVEHINSLNKVLKQIYKICNSNTLIIASWYNPLWEPIIRIADVLKLKMPEGPHKIVSMKTFINYLENSGFTLVDRNFKILLPVDIFKIADIINDFAEKIYAIKKFLFYQIVIFRKKINCET